MPGIAGLISDRPAADCQRIVASMLRSMRHEPFYTSGTYAVPELGVFAGWVALERSFAGRQPALNARGDVALLLSGECFADSDIRVAANDAGWLVQRYENRGDEVFAELNGLFSGLLVDQRRQSALLFNDRYGMERLYYHEASDGFYFASEAKALLRVLPNLRVFDDEGVAQTLNLGCTLGPRTLFRDVSLLPSASLWTFSGRKCSKSRYFVAAGWESEPPLPPDAFEARFEETFRRILPRYFKGDLAMGISLTGGLDTRMIMACKPDGPAPLVSYTFDGLRGETLDASLAARVASVAGLPHHVLRIGRDFLTDFSSIADRTVYITDGCLGVCGSHEIYLNRQARSLAPVRLTGNFGSEILRGTSTFKSLGLAPALIDPEFWRRVSGDATSPHDAVTHPVSLAAFREIPWLLSAVARAAQSQLVWRTPYLDNDLVALAYRCPVELRRSPLPASHLVLRNYPALAEIPTDRGLALARAGLGSAIRSFWRWVTFKLDYVHNAGMPHWLSPLDSWLYGLGADQWLFGSHKYLPYRAWFRRELAGLLHERLTEPGACRLPYWNREFLLGLASSHIDGRKNYLHEINAVLTLETVDRLLLRQTTEPTG